METMWPTSEKMDGYDFSMSDSEDVHVLAVDDSVIDRKVIERLLRISSCKVTAVDSGIRALQFLGLDEENCASGFDDSKVDLIITDYCMPGMTGYDLLKKIKESSALKRIPVVIMSSENVLARIKRCLEEGAEDFIVKPVKLADVKRIKDFMTKDMKIGHEEEEDSKRKLEEILDEPPFSSLQFISLASSDDSLPSLSSSSAPSSPSSSDSPTR